MQKRKTGIGAALLASVLLAGAAVAEPIAPPVLDLDGTELSLGGAASGAVFSHSLSGPGASGVVQFQPRLERDYDSGLSLALAATLSAQDPLSRGRYDGDVLEKAYGEAHVLLSTVRVGLVDGAAYDLAVTGPRTDPAIALDDARTSFFQDPGSHRAVTDIFALRTPVGASSNYAKILLESPELFGAKIAISFTPSEGKNGLPFLAAGPHLSGRQADIWEGAARYSDDFGPLTVSASLAGATGRGEHKLPGQEGVSDYGAGLAADWRADDDLTLSLGGSWRQSNAYAFDINRAFNGATTRVLDASAGAQYRDWSLALEYGGGNAGAVAGNARLNLNGYEASLGYDLDKSVMVSGGWQHLNYDRDAGAFFNGTPRLSLDAVFLHLSLRTVR